MAKWIANSYQSKERIKLLKDSSDVRIYTSKSDSGLQLSLLSDFITPDLDDEALNEYVNALCNSVLSLIGVNLNESNSLEFILLAHIFYTILKQKNHLISLK